MPTKIGGIKVFALKEINEQLGGYLLLPSDNILSKASSGDKSGMFLRKTSGIFLRETALRARSKPKYAARYLHKTGKEYISWINLYGFS